MVKNKQRSSSTRRRDNITSGLILRGPVDPPSIVTIPWCSQKILVRHPFVQDDKEFSLTVGYLDQLLEFQTNIPVALHKSFQILSLRVWGGVSDLGNDGIYVNVFDLRPNTDGTNAYTDYLVQLADFGTVSNRACVGYRWPRGISQLDVLSSQDVNFKIADFQRADAAATQWVFEVTLRWKPRVLQNPSRAFLPQN